MCSMLSIILCFTFLNFFVIIESASQLPPEDSYGILSTESAIRSTANNLFSSLNLKVMQNKLKLKQYSTIHNFFVSITLRDHENLKKIAKLTEVDNIDKGTLVFITQLNEVLSEDNKSDEATDSVYVAFLIEDFVKRIDDLTHVVLPEVNLDQSHLKAKHGDFNSTKTFDLNTAIVRYFNNNEHDFENATYSKEEFVKRNDSDDNYLSENEFWQPSGRRIFQGIVSDVERFPFMAAIQFFGRFQCSGSIIKSDLIITSASCLQIAWNNRYFRENPLFLSVQVGSTYYDHGGEHIPVLEIYFHPSFDPKTLRHNLAIMRLSKSVKFGKNRSRKVKKIDFDRHPSPLPSNTDGIIVAGWGVKVFGGTVVASRKNKLSSAKLEFYPLDECQEIYTRDFVTDRNFCAGFFSKGGGACNHDAGGPGISGGILVGVISFGAPVCGTADAPTVFTKLGYYTDWIEEIVERVVPSARQPTTLRPLNFPTFRLPPVTRKIPIKVMPIVDGKPYKSSQPEVVRTNDETEKFRALLKTVIKKQKQQERKGNKNHMEQDKTLEGDTEANDSPYESENISDSFHKPKKVKNSSHKTKKVKKPKAKRVKEIQKFTVKPVLKNKSEKVTEKKKKHSSSKTKDVPKRKEKNIRLKESQRQSKEKRDKTISIDRENESREALRFDEEFTQSFTPQVEGNKEASSGQDTEIDEAINSLIENLNLDYIMKPERSSKKNKENEREKDDKNPKKINKYKSDSNSKSNKVRENDSGEENGNEENSSNEYKNTNKISSDYKTTTKQYTIQSTKDKNSHDSQENEDSKEVTQEIKINNEHFRADDNAETSDDEEESDQDKIALSIIDETSELDTSSSNSTDRLIDMLDYEDIYKLLSGHTSDRQSIHTVV